ncbi:MAG TPA: hypothetical protein VMO17_09615 [Terriglobia bacterium]|nr:hypothetical protein [Terriglobia bacterium]
MIESCIVLIFSAALFFFYWQVTVQRILRRAFAQAYFRVIVAANRLEFPALRTAVLASSGPVDYARLRMNIKCDYQALTYLLKNASNLRQSLTRDERFLMVYFRLLIISLSIRHWLGMQEKPAVLGLADILQYFANIVGERVNSLRVAPLALSPSALGL